MFILDFVGKRFNDKGEESVNSAQHRAAKRILDAHQSGLGTAMGLMLTGWEMYAKAHRERYESGIGEDGTLGDYWAEIGLNIKRLLDGETNGWDCGSLSHNIVCQLDAEKIQHDGYTLNAKGE